MAEFTCISVKSKAKIGFPNNKNNEYLTSKITISQVVDHLNAFKL